MEIAIFRPKHKSLTKNMNFRISNQRVHLSSKVGYLGVVLKEYLEWEHLNILTPKLNITLGLLAKIRHYVPKFNIILPQDIKILVSSLTLWGEAATLAFADHLSSDATTIKNT